MSQAARAPRKGPPEAAPDIALVTGAAKPVSGEKTAEKPAAKPAARPEDGASTPVVTLEDPWRYLHPSRVWPD